MLYYQPTSGDPLTEPISSLPRHCFLMTQLGGKVDPALNDMRDLVATVLKRYDFKLVDADSKTTGRDFLLKIWRLVLSVPVGVALAHESMPPETLANIFYEVGLMHSYGKETLVLKSPKAKVPSDFVRTEWVPFDSKAEGKLDQFMDEVGNRPEYYGKMADILENNPLLSIDYLRRAYLVCGEKQYRERAQKYLEEAGLEGRAKNSVEMLFAQF